MGTKLDRLGLRRQRRGVGRAAACFISCSLAIFAAGCGSSGADTPADSEKAADVEILTEALAQELTTVAAYGQGLALLRGPTLAVAGEFRGQGQSHVDALTKAIRGLGGEVEAEASELETPGPQSRMEALVLAYEGENAALAQALSAAPSLHTPAPRTLVASLAASHAQHLAVLRQTLGAGLAESVPDAFESGYLPPPAAAGNTG
ncbi:MAG: ferritin-like domain-containing protein [Solirubrobacterales bacterium]